MITFKIGVDLIIMFIDNFCFCYKQAANSDHLLSLLY